MSSPYITPEAFEKTFLSAKDFDPENPQIGVYKDLPNDLYHGSKHFSSTRLKQAVMSIDHFNKPGMETTKAMFRGSAAHTMILEPDTFRDRIQVRPEVKLNSNAGKDSYIDFLQSFVKHGLDPGSNYSKISRSDFYKKLEQIGSKQDFHIITSEDMVFLEECYVQASKVKNNGFFGPLSNGWNELSAFVKDEATGLLIKARWDNISIENRCIIDLKSTVKDLTNDNLGKVIGDFGYGFSAALYIRIARQLGIEIDHYIFAWVQSVPPYHVRMTKLGDFTLMESEKSLLPDALEKVKFHLDNPGDENTGLPYPYMDSVEKSYYSFCNEFKIKYKAHLQS